MFDPFKFLEERRAGLRVNDVDKDEFVLYNVVQAVSMDYRFSRLTHLVNDISFSHLPKDIQAMAFNSLNNVKIDTRWHRAKSTAIKEKEENIMKAMTIMNTSHSNVESELKYNLLDMDAVTEAYTRRYEPEKLLETKKKKR